MKKGKKSRRFFNGEFLSDLEIAEMKPGADNIAAFFPDHGSRIVLFSAAVACMLNRYFHHPAFEAYHPADSKTKAGR